MGTQAIALSILLPAAEEEGIGAVIVLPRVRGAEGLVQAGVALPVRRQRPVGLGRRHAHLLVDLRILQIFPEHAAVVDALRVARTQGGACGGVGAAGGVVGLVSLEENGDGGVGTVSQRDWGGGCG